ncbi:MAG: HEAT repeat domain-containing protein [Phycisphaerae bacterium]|nr:HEAT repeat domain-containing protein [Phycisphaerae bacterium]
MIDPNVVASKGTAFSGGWRANGRVRLGALRCVLSPGLATVICALHIGSAVPAQGSAPEVEPPPRVADAVLHRPSPVPDRIVLSWVGDAATGRAVTWRTSTDVNRAFAEIAPAESGPGFLKQRRRVDAVTRPFKSALLTCHVHSTEFKDLKPATKYVYRVGDGRNFSEWFQFRTAAAAPEPFSFIYFGDAQTDLRSMWSRVVRQAWSDAPKAAFMLHAGDLVNRAESDAEWGEWFGAGGWLNGMIPVVATPGNHEYASAKEPDGRRVRRITGHWAPQFTFPANGPAGLEETVYYLDYQNLRIISLNSNERQEEQTAWLEQVLSKNDRTWTVITFHHPIFSTAKGRDNPTLREIWKPVFDRHRVDLVLTGHDHTYGRTGLIGAETNASTGTNWRSAAAGTVYVVSVSGPKMYSLDRTPRAEMLSVAENTQLYQIISIDGPLLRYEAHTATGDVHDAFVLCKDEALLAKLAREATSGPEAQRHQAAKTLSLVCSAKTLEHLGKLLASDDVKVRRVAATGLGRFAQASARDLALRLAADSDAEVRRGAAMAIARSATAQQADVVQRLLKDSDADVRAAAAAFFLNVQGPEVADLVLIALDDANVAVRRLALHGIDGIEGEALKRILLKAVADPDGEVAGMAIKRLSGDKLGDGFVEPLTRAVKHKSPGVRYASLLALVQIGDREKLMPILIEAVGDPDPEVQGAAVGTLERWSKKRYGFKADKWRQWYAEQKK